MVWCICKCSTTWNLATLAASGILPWDKRNISLGAKWMKSEPWDRRLAEPQSQFRCCSEEKSPSTAKKQIPIVSSSSSWSGHCADLKIKLISVNCRLSIIHVLCSE